MFIYRNIEFLKSLDVYVFLKKRNKVVMSFLDGLSEDHASPLTKCVALEQMYSINSPYLVAPFSFTRNVLQYQATQSRVSTELNGKLGPCGGYTTITNWLTHKVLNQWLFLCLTVRLLLIMTKL